MAHDVSFFFFNDTATTEIYTLSLHDALPICCPSRRSPARRSLRPSRAAPPRASSCPNRCGPPAPRYEWIPSNTWACGLSRSEEHTSELQSRLHLVCRLLLEKKKTTLLKRPQH